MSVEAFLCRNSKQFLAVSFTKTEEFSAPRLSAISCGLEAYFAGSAKRKLSLAESSNGYHAMAFCSLSIDVEKKIGVW
jgi:hypothetical protein